YCSHAAQTVLLVQGALESLSAGPLTRIFNTHLHSDHCGGNAALLAAWPKAQVAVPPGEAQAARDWNESALSYRATAQDCPRFAVHRVLAPGETLQLGPLSWKVLAAPGHDPHSVVLYQREHKLLISADALWENGFGVVFPELEGEQAFDEVAGTLDVIEALDVECVLPGHGRLFHDAPAAIARARVRLEGFVRAPSKHARYAVKALVMYRMMAEQRMREEALVQLLAPAHFYRAVAQRWAGGDTEGLLRDVIQELVERGQLVRRTEADAASPTLLLAA
ncbi:MAG TPA: MBL fold metallo-hydrolase, partial [Burkholderiaceae bacterium]|nr:MBL fold metallo-hydrolase [Burkholderiaceae bacterium]